MSITASAAAQRFELPARLGQVGLRLRHADFEWSPIKLSSASPRATG